MIRQLDLNNDTEVVRILEIQQAAYQVEAELIGFDEIPPLFDTPELLRESHETFYGCFVDGTLAGIIATEYETEVLVISRLGVHPDYFRRGVATALLNYVETLPSSARCLRVSTGTINAPARQLYERHGFIKIGEHQIAIGVTMTDYEKWIMDST
jgi:ribosomal protein S18 acetylase RimI-like enzyme